MASDFVTIARVVKPQGRRGEVAAELHTDFPELFAERTRLYARPVQGETRELEVEEFWEHKGRVVLKFRGVDSIDDAELLVGSELQIPASERVQLGPGAAYVSDLVGCTLLASEVAGPEREVGKIADVQFGAGAAPLLIVRENGKEYLVPFAEEYLKELDLAGKRLVMALPEGMLELDAPLSSEEKRTQARPESK